MPDASEPPVLRIRFEGRELLGQGQERITVGLRGTVLLVSHDRALLREVWDEFWLVARGRVEPFDGDLDDYQRWLVERSREVARAAREAEATAATARDDDAWDAFRARYLDVGGHDEYRKAVGL